MEYGSYFAAYKPALTDEYMKKKLRWAHEHVHWTDEQWSSVIWRHEFWFTVASNDSGVRVIRKIGEQYDAKHIVPTKKYGGGGVMIWSCAFMQMVLALWSWLTVQLTKTNTLVF
ncbi:hypothetical protein RMATCC62417_17990 [Rhizopus microsporus]|nr:hypothetical protein RMATCC62417_17990 [Rhizopus microsporus]